MKKTWLRWLYRFHQETFADFLVEDFYGSIPKEVSEPFLTVMAEKRVKVDRLLLYQAYLIQRRIANSPKEVHTLFGMLLQIKLFMRFIASVKAQPEGTEGTKSVRNFTEEQKKIVEETNKAMDGVKSFLKAGKE